MYNEIIRNVIITVVSILLVMIIFVLISYYVLPFLWERLNINELIVQKIKEVVGL